MRKRSLKSRILSRIKRLLGYYKLHYKIVKNGCPKCGEDLETCEVAVTCHSCGYQIVAG